MCYIILQYDEFRKFSSSSPCAVLVNVVMGEMLYLKTLENQLEAICNFSTCIHGFHTVVDV